jgi:deazaflavin-dependent oxidoreductase (nitroreductase family)
MIDPTSPPTARLAPRARTLPVQGLVNRFIRGLLRTPILCRAVGQRLLILQVVGRKSGRRYRVPVAYTRHDGSLLVASQFGWIRNLRSGSPVQIRLAGKKRLADVQLLSDEAGVVEYLARMATDNHQFAKFNAIGLDHDGNPVPEDLHLAWAAGGRVAILTPR